MTEEQGMVSGDAPDAAGQIKKQAKNDAKRREKLARFAAKQEKMATAKRPQEKLAREISKVALADDGSAHETVVPGEKKDMSGPIAPTYSPAAVEAGWYSWWERLGCFMPEAVASRSAATATPRPTFVLPIPPPNVTGSLHLGHALATSLQDALVRWKRMCGYQTLYIPGTDHAGISCQVVVEKQLQKTRGLSRHDLGRDAFVREVWQWKDTYGHKITDQFRRLGGSMDWTRFRFTLDASMCVAVNEAFVQLFDRGIIYRDKRLVNWSGKLQTTVSDLEVDHVQLAGTTRMAAFGHDGQKTYEFGTLFGVAYKVDGGQEKDEIIVMTSRPETIPGDVGVAVHPADGRYVGFHGSKLVHPIFKTRVPLVLDTAVDMDFGTGAVKLTPAHDGADYGMALRHGLPMVSIFDGDNRLNEQAGPFAGLMRFDGRDAVVRHLQTEGLYRGSTSHAMTLPVCSRSGDIIEPRLMPQWWMSCTDMARDAVRALDDGRLRLVPAESEKIWRHWLTNSRDWCLSRQLWWGHRVPAYSVQLADGDGDGDANGDGSFCHRCWIAARSDDEALARAQTRFPGQQVRIQQDEDVLDTWFSSGLWPFATLGWPTKTDDLARFYPADVLETGRDIIFFWVARMVMLGLSLTGQVPFHTVYLHPIVRDAHGKKMSKSLGNVIDPLDVISGITLDALHERLHEGNLDRAEIARARAAQSKDFPSGIKACGADALRFALCSYTSTGGADINLDLGRIEGYRRFCNKVWNAVRFALAKLGVDGEAHFVPGPVGHLAGRDDATLWDVWILGRLAFAVRESNASLGEYNFMRATACLYKFWMYELCDVYIEAIKAHSGPTMRNTLYVCVEHGLLLLHPFMPFITEELFQRLPPRPDRHGTTTSISLEPYPQPMEQWEEAARHVQGDHDVLMTLVRTVRSVVAERCMQGSFDVELMVEHGESRTADMQMLVQTHMGSLRQLVRGLQTIRFGEHAGHGEPVCIASLGISCNIRPMSQ